MLIKLLKLIIPPFSFRVYYRRIFYSNLKKVPLEKPLIFAGNHPNSFMDGMIVGAYLGQPIHFLMRGDMFKNIVASWFLRELNVAPVYRFQEGLENVHKNLETFSVIYDMLNKNKNLIVFSEGISVQKKRLQKLKKGTGRMAFGAEAKYGADVHIVPVGINYTNPAKFRREIMINFHDPIRIKDMKAEYEENNAKALLKLNRKIEEALKKEVIIVEDSENDIIAEELLMIERNNHIHPFFKWKHTSDDRRQREKAVCDKVNLISADSPEILEDLKNKVFEYTSLLNKLKITDRKLAVKLDFGLLRYLSLIIGLPFFAAGYLINLIPFIVPGFLSGKLIKNPVFYSSTYVSIGTVVYLIWYPLIIIFAWLFFEFYVLISVALAPLLGYVVLFYIEILKERYNTLMFTIRKRRYPELINDMRKRRKAILDILDSISL